MTPSADAGAKLDIADLAAQWHEEGREFALATVAETWGSAPRPVGSHLIVDDQGHFEGSVSGGCVEGEVLSEAEQVIADGKPRFLSFGVADETAWRVGLSCGGRISVLVQTAAPTVGTAGPLLADLTAARQRREPVVLATDIDSGRTEMLRSSDPVPQTELGSAMAERLESGVSGIAETAAGRAMINAYLPAPRLVILGAVHIGQALAPMAAAAGFEVSVIDPRTAFAAPERLPGVRVFAQWPEDALPEIGIDRYTAFAALTHDPKIDDPGIEAALAARCFYVGALGSSKTHQKRIARLAERGIDESLLALIKAPIGLAIGARTPAEIAVATLAEIIDAKTTFKAAQVEAAA